MIGLTLMLNKPFQLIAKDAINTGRFFTGDAVSGNLAMSSSVSSEWGDFLETAAGGNGSRQAKFQSAWNTFIASLNTYFTSTTDTGPYVLPRLTQGLWADILKNGEILTGVSGSQVLTSDGNNAIQNIFTALANGNAAVVSHFNSLLTEGINQLNTSGASLTTDDVMLGL